MSDRPTRLPCHTPAVIISVPVALGPLALPRLAAGAGDGCSLDGLGHGYVADSWSLFKCLQEEAGTGILTLLRSFSAIGPSCEK